MPAKPIFDLAGIDLNAVVADQEAIRQVNAQRGDMEHLNGVVWTDATTNRIVGYKDVRENEFWVPGHIPGRPLLPGVIMIETAAQLSSYYTKAILKWPGFIGFGGIEDCKFRAQVTPGCRMYILSEQLWARHKRIASRTQGIVGDQIAFEATIIGAMF